MSGPVGLRTIFRATTRHQPFRSLVRGCYALASRSCAEKFQRVHGVESVHLCSPPAEAGADLAPLDLLLVVRPNPWTQAESAFIGEIRQVYRRLQSPVPRLGKLQVVPSSLWDLLQRVAPAPVLRYRHRRRYQSGRWQPPKERGMSVSARSRFALCFKYYLRGQSHWSKAAVDGPAQLRRFRKEIWKALSLAADPPTRGLVDRSDEELSAEAFLALHRLAMEAAREGAPNSFNGEIQFEKGPESSVPGLWVWRDPIDAASVLRLFEDEARLYRTSAGPRPAVVSPQMLECYWRGWSWGKALQNLRTVPHAYREDPGERAKLARHLFQSLFERGVMHLHELGGKLVAASREQLEALLLDLGVEAMALAAHTFTRDWATLYRRANTSLPRTCALLQHRRYSRWDPQDRGFIDEVLRVRDEIENLFYNSLSLL